MTPFPDLHTSSQQSPSIAPQVMAAAATVNGTGIDISDCEAVELELSLGTLTGAPTGGVVTLTPQESDVVGSGYAQVNTDTVVAAFGDTFPEVLRYRYIGGATGKHKFVRLSVTTPPTGGTTPTIAVAGNVLKGGLRYAGQQPTVGSAPQTPTGGITN